MLQSFARNKIRCGVQALMRRLYMPTNRFVFSYARQIYKSCTSNPHAAVRLYIDAQIS